MPPRRVKRRQSRIETHSPEPQTIKPGTEFEVRGITYPLEYFLWSFSPFHKNLPFDPYPYPQGVRIHVLLSMDALGELLGTIAGKLINDNKPNMPRPPGMELGFERLETKTFYYDKVNTKTLLSGKYQVVGHALKIVANWDEETRETRQWMPLTIKIGAGLREPDVFHYFVLPISPNEEIHIIG